MILVDEIHGIGPEARGRIEGQVSTRLWDSIWWRTWDTVGARIRWRVSHLVQAAECKNLGRG